MNIIGHQANIDRLTRFADKRALPHGFLFFGPEGVGKKQVALGLARYLEAGTFTVPPPDFLKAKEATSFRMPLGDRLLILPDETGKIGIDEVRRIRYFLSQRPNRSPYRVLILDEAERLTREAEHALLKITEEPPEAGILILIARDPELLLPTITSRLAPLYFSLVPQAQVQEWLRGELLLNAKEAARFTKDSLGAPGLAVRLFSDKRFQRRLLLAEEFLALRDRKEIIKKILQPDDFNFGTFLDALILCLAREEFSSAKRALWHELLELRGNESYFNLNPRIQLTALGTSL